MTSMIGGMIGGHEGDPQRTGEGGEFLRERAPVLISGLPGTMATLVAEALNRSQDFALVDVGLSSVRHSQETIAVDGKHVDLIALPSGILLPPKEFFTGLGEGLIVVDYANSVSVNGNAELYAQVGLPFVMGTTGGDREQLVETVRKSEICAVIAPNMAFEVVRVQQVVETLAQNAPGLFNGWEFDIVDSHQNGKGRSGTADAFSNLFIALGAVSRNRVEIRDPEKQRALGIPDEYLKGHAYHWMTLQSPDGVSTIEFRTQVNGRQPYVDGTLMALRFLREQVAAGAKGQVFSMVDVLASQAR